MKLRGVSLAAGLFLLALKVRWQPAEAAVSLFFSPNPRLTPSPHSHAEITFCPFSSFLIRLGLGIQI